jgi:hypothetical protein
MEQFYKKKKACEIAYHTAKFLVAMQNLVNDLPVHHMLGVDSDIDILFAFHKSNSKYNSRIQNMSAIIHIYMVGVKQTDSK